MAQDAPPVTPRDRAIDRIRKLGAKAQSTTFEGERRALLEKMVEIMNAHHLEIADVVPRPEPPRRPIPQPPGTVFTVFVSANGMEETWEGTVTNRTANRVTSTFNWNPFR